MSRRTSKQRRAAKRRNEWVTRTRALFHQSSLSLAVAKDVASRFRGPLVGAVLPKGWAESQYAGLKESFPPEKSPAESPPSWLIVATSRLK